MERSSIPLKLGVLKAAAVLGLLTMVGCSRASPPPRASRGVLDLRSFRFDDESVVALRGEWALHWNQLLAPGDVSSPDGFLPVGRWNGQRLLDGRELPGKGYATYRLLVRLPTETPALAVALMPLIDASSLEVSTPTGDRLAGPVDSGIVGTAPASSRGYVRNRDASFNAVGDVMITLHVSNFEHRWGGAGPTPLLGSVEAMRTRDRHRRMMDFFVIGLLCVVGLQHLGQFAFSRRDRPWLWFGLSCFVIALRMIILGRYFSDEVSTFPASLSMRVEYATGYFGLVLVTLFLRSLFPAHTRRRIVQVIVAIAAALTATLILPRSIYTQLQPIFQATLLFGLGYACYVLVRAALRDRDLPPVLVLLGFICLGGGIVHDILRVNLIVQSPITTTHYGLSAFVLFQSAVLATMNRRRGRELEQRNRDVQLLNEELRGQIANRSHELSQALALIATPRAPVMLEPGSLLVGKYRVGKLLGQGAMGRVYQATRLSDEQPVAVKLMRASDPQMLARFAREAELVARINHPNVVGIHDFGVTNEAMLFLVMELIDGRNLEDQRTHFGDVTWALPLVRQLAIALEAIHERGVIHRDVKPSNILVAHDGKLKLTDFGVAHVTRSVEPDRSRASTTSGISTARDDNPASTAMETMDVALTRAGMLIGSPLYMAPELGLGAEFASARSDVFSFGLVAYELLSGQRAHAQSVALARIQGQPLPNPPAPLATLINQLPTDLASAFDACLHVTPAGRPDAATIVRLFAAHLP